MYTNFNGKWPISKKTDLEVSNKDIRKPPYLFHKIPKTLIYPEVKYLCRVDNKIGKNNVSWT